MTRRILLVLLTSGACLFASGNLPAATASSSSTSSTSPEQAAREEIVRRQEAQIAARKLIDEGKKLYYSGKYQDAIAKLEEAVRILPRAKATEIDYSSALQGLTTSYSRLADAAFQAGDYVKARELAQKALEYDPKNHAAENVIIKTKKIGSTPTTTGGQSSAAASSSSGSAPDQTPEFLARKDQIKKLFREGKILMNSGQYDEAERRFQQVLMLDPYNADAETLLRSVDKARNDIAMGAGDESRTRRLREVEDAWVPPLNRESQPPPIDKDSSVISREAVRQQGIVRKLNEIIVPEINYREAVVSDVITFLSDESRRLDLPDHVGVNIVLGGGIAAPSGPAAPPTAPPPVPAPGAAAEPGAAAGAGEVEGRKITLSLRNVPLIEALKYVTTLANLKYRVESSAVIVLPIDAPSGDMVTRIYPVNPGAFRPSVEVTNYTAVTTQTQATGGGAGGAAQASPAVQSGPASVLPQVSISVSTNTIKQMFVDAGVLFPTNSSIFYNERTSIIVVHNTVENLEDFERVLATFNAIPPQVQIEAKFVEISQNDLDELGFDWQVGTKQLGSFDATGGNGSGAFPPGSGTVPNQSFDVTSGLRDSTVIQGNAIDALLASAGFGTTASGSSEIGTIRGILTDPQFQVIIKALSQKQSSDVLSSPKVTTISGAQAQIRVAQEFIYPTTFSTAVIQPGTAVSGAIQAPTVTPSTPTAFATRPVGVVFNVTPFVGADGYTISLTLIPQVTDFLGFINYGNVINLGTVTTANDIKQPLFSTRDLITSVVIWDGQTVVLGGLITEQLQKIDDKVPFLGDIPMVGRLFRTKTTSRSKRNLLIFVTARLIDPSGNPIHRTPITASAR
ncbi:MAG TPA: tetratricopeptide repeat protein [Verrucomicrobiae bacterium]|nr:tetratricopeptide repeat protein [Verrucomicrobiae bacterium]